jgi:hypothetical protein
MGVQAALKLPMDERKSMSDYATGFIGVPKYKIIDDAPTKVGGFTISDISYLWDILPKTLLS